MMTDNLSKALKYLGKEDADVLAHGPSVDGQAYVVVIAPGPKYRVAWSDMEEPAQPEKHPPYERSYRDLQKLAKFYGIPANQSKEALFDSLAALSSDEEE